MARLARQAGLRCREKPPHGRPLCDSGLMDRLRDWWDGEKPQDAVEKVRRWWDQDGPQDAVDHVRNWWKDADGARRPDGGPGAVRRPAGLGEKPPPWSRARDFGSAPVTDEQGAWVEKSVDWCLHEFGDDVLRYGTALPIDVLPRAYDASSDQVRELVETIADVMSVQCDDIEVEFFRTPPETARKKHAVGTYQQRGGQAVISLDRAEVGDPHLITAIIAHELGHVRLLGEQRIDPARADMEPLTDLATVVFGLGVFTTNGAMTFTKTVRGWSALPLGDITERELLGSGHGPYSRYGYLDEKVLAHALAYLSFRRGEHTPAWRASLEPGPRAAFDKSMAHFYNRRA